jgi:Fe-S-cluster containining protein
MKDQHFKIEHHFSLLRNDIESTCNKLHRQHHEFTSCKKGCDECCMNFKLLPVEFYSILNSIKDTAIAIRKTDNPEECPFLVDHCCQIYEFRPLICRSHGLPILNMDEEGENWELSFCPLNFIENDHDYFTNENCYQQDLYNSKLYLLNQEFINHFNEKKIDKTTMYDLRELGNQAININTD